MSGIELLSIKQTLTKLTEEERREVSAFIQRLGQESEDWKAETSRRLDEMAAGEKTNVADLRQQLGHA